MQRSSRPQLRHISPQVAEGLPKPAYSVIGYCSYSSTWPRLTAPRASACLSWSASRRSSSCRARSLSLSCCLSSISFTSTFTERWANKDRVTQRYKLTRGEVYGCAVRFRCRAESERRRHVSIVSRTAARRKRECSPGSFFDKAGTTCYLPHGLRTSTR